MNIIKNKDINKSKNSVNRSRMVKTNKIFPYLVEYMVFIFHQIRFNMKMTAYIKIHNVYNVTDLPNVSSLNVFIHNTRPLRTPVT